MANLNSYQMIAGMKKISLRGAVEIITIDLYKDDNNLCFCDATAHQVLQCISPEYMHISQS